MRLENLFESNYKMLLNEVKSSIETRAVIQQVILNYKIPYDETLPIYDQNYPTPSSRSQMLKAVNSNIYSLQNDISNYLKSNEKVLPSSIKWSQSNFIHQETNERSLSRHITFNLKDFPSVLLNIKITDHYLKNNVAKSKTSYVYFTRVTNSFTDDLRNRLNNFINSVYKREKFLQTGEKEEPEIVKQTIIPRDEALPKEQEPVKQEKKVIRDQIHLEVNNSLPSSRETYRDLIAPTKEGIKYGFYYDTSVPYIHQNFPNEKVKESYDKKLAIHTESVVNDLAKTLYSVEKIDKEKIFFNRSHALAPDGSLSSSVYVSFRFKNHAIYGVIRIQDHPIKSASPRAMIYNMGQSTYVSQAFREKFIPFLKSLYSAG